MSHQTIAVQATGNDGIPTTKKDDHDQETLAGGCKLCELESGIGSVFRFGSIESEEDDEPKLKDVLCMIEDGDIDFRHGEAVENIGADSGGGGVNYDVPKEANESPAPTIEDKVAIAEKEESTATEEDATATQFEEDAISEEGGKGTDKVATAKRDDDIVTTDADAADVATTEEDDATAFQTEEDAITEDWGKGADDVAAANAAACKAEEQDSKGERAMNAGEDHTDVSFATPPQQTRSIVDTATELEVADSGERSSYGVSDSIKGFVALARTYDSELDMNGMLWKTLLKSGNGLELSSLGSPNLDEEVEGGDGKDGGNVLDNDKCLNRSTVISDGEPEATVKNFGPIDDKHSLLAGTKAKVNTLSDSLSDFLADDEISDGSDLFDLDSFSDAKVPKVMNAGAMSRDRVSECTGALGDCRDDVAISDSKGDDLNERNDVPQSIQVRCEDSMQDCLDYSSDSAATGSTTVIYLGTSIAQKRLGKEIGIQVGSHEKVAEENWDLAGCVSELEATAEQAPLTKEIGIQVGFFDEIGTEESWDLANRILVKVEQFQEPPEQISTLANEILALEEKHNTSLSLFRRQLSILKRKHATAVTEKLVMKDEAKRMIENNDDLLAHFLVLKGKCEALMIQKVAAEAKTECLMKTNLAANVINVVGWIATLLLILALRD